MEKRKVIMSKTPLRITFVGGGTDIPSYYQDHGPGAVVSAAINKHVYITLHKRFDNKIRVSYSTTELVDNVDEIKHPTVRESLRLLDLGNGLEVITFSDIPAGGTGMGSSSSFLVGVPNSLHAWKGEYATPEQLAQEAIKIEREVLKEPGGKQDQYIAAYGGLQLMEFRPNGTVFTKPIIMNEDSLNKLQNHLLLLYVGGERKSAEIHTKQRLEVPNRISAYDKMRDMAYGLSDSLSHNKWQDTGRYIHNNWILKKTLAAGITNSSINRIYETAISAGAEGGKLIGAGGTGFMMFFANPKKHAEIIRALPLLRREPFEFTYQGSRIVYVGD